MNFQVDSVTSTYDTNAAYSQMYGERSGQRDGSTTSAPGAIGAKTGIASWFGGAGGLNVVGLNANEIPNMKAAITTMVERIEAKINELETETDSEIAFKGPGVKNALQEYLRQVALYCTNLSSNLKAFNDKLTDVRNQWEAATGNMSEKVSSTGGAFATGSAYSEQLQ